MGIDHLPRGLAAALRVEADTDFLHAVHRTAVRPESHEELMAMRKSRPTAAVGPPEHPRTSGPSRKHGSSSGRTT